MCRVFYVGMYRNMRWLHHCAPLCDICSTQAWHRDLDGLMVLLVMSAMSI